MKTNSSRCFISISTIGLAVLLVPLAAHAQVNTGSDGRDGAFNPTTSTAVDMADHPDGIYQCLEVLLNGHANLEERFAQIDLDTVRRELHAAQNPPERVPPRIRQLIRVPAFPETLSALFHKAA